MMLGYDIYKIINRNCTLCQIPISIFVRTGENDGVCLPIKYIRRIEVIDSEAIITHKGGTCIIEKPNDKFLADAVTALQHYRSYIITGHCCQ